MPNGGRRTTVSHGYVLVNINGRWRYEHRVVMERILGRCLTRSETVHHLNGNRKDNRPENLTVFDSHSHHLALTSPRRVEEFACEWCGAKELMSSSQLRHPKTKNERRRFCSRRCFFASLKGRPFSGTPYRGGHNQWTRVYA